MAEASGPAPVKGTLRVTAFGSRSGRPGEPALHSTVYVPGPAYDGMEDNDIRGFVDGGFQWAYNQVSQTHVRLGRNSCQPMHLKYGEPEVFRVLQRWEGIRLPPGSRVVECSLTLCVEFTSDATRRILAYAVNHDWNPGVGGVKGNNVSVANPGEVWWNEIGFGERPWGLPGAGFAADGPGADTGPMPLADATIRPGDTRLEFRSPALARYVDERLDAGEPLLFLLKLSDACEDEPGSLTGLYSASEGDSLSLARRPRLCLTWTNPNCAVLHEQQVLLEHGRSVTIPVIAVPEESWLDVEFMADPDCEAPTIEWLDGADGFLAAPQRTDGPFRATGAGRLRVTALQNPVDLGTPVQIRFRDTWILTGPPETRDVHWECTSPSGVVRHLAGEYAGDYAWSLRFVPDEVGRWHFRLRHRLAESPYAGPTGVVDVRVGNAAPALEALRELIPGINAARESADAETLGRLRRRFIHLQRAIMSGQTPETFRSAAGVRMTEELRRVRSALWGDAVPPEPPLESTRLCEEHEGVTLQDPIPYTEHLEGHAPPASPGRVVRFGKRIGRRVRRTAGRIRPEGKDAARNE